MPPEPTTPGPADPDALPFPACVPDLSDDAVTLSAHRAADLLRIVEQCASPEMQRWVPVPQPYQGHHAQEFLDRVAAGWTDPQGRREWAIRDGDGTYLGTVGLFDRSASRAEVGYALHPDARGRGVAARAVRLACRWAFDQGVRVVQWRAEVGNWASRRVAWACGFDQPVVVRGNGLDAAEAPRDMWHATVLATEPMRPRTRWLTAAEATGERVRLREFTEADEHWLPEVRDERAARFLTSGLPSRQGYAAWLTRQRDQACAGEAIQWAVAARHTDEVVGGIVLSQLAHPRTAGTATLGYWLLPQWRGQGLMAQALDLALPLAFARGEPGLGLRAVRAVTDATNLESARVLRAAGFRSAGRERTAYTHAGEAPTDALVFDLLATDDREDQRVRPLSAPVIETERLRLRPWCETDRPNPADDPDAAALRFMPAGAQPGHSDFDTWLIRKREFADRAVSQDWCIADRATDRALGGVSLFVRGERPIDFDAELGYWIFPSARGRRLLGEALPPVLDHAFRSRDDGGLGVSRVHAGADSDNTASISIMLRAGLREGGRDRQAYRRQDGSLSDGFYAEVLATDPR